MCQICADAAMMKRAAELIAQQLPDQRIAEQLGLSGHAGRMAVSRHRRNHIEKPARALASAANKGRAVAEQRKASIEAAGRGDEVAVFLGLEEITRDTRKISKRLGRAAKATEQAGQFTAMTGVVAQQHKNLELRGKLGNHPGFTPQKLTPGGEAAVFNLTINLPGQTERLSFSQAEHVPDPVIDATPFQLANESASAPDGAEDDTQVEADQRSQERQQLARAFGVKY
jgi:hypothetical protein